MAQYKIGDLLKSKAGGPKLVVDSVKEPDQFFGGENKEAEYWCIWWVGSKRHRESFSEGGLGLPRPDPEQECRGHTASSKETVPRAQSRA